MCYKQYSARLTRWLDRLAHIDISIQHIAGSNLKFADFLSRNPVEGAATENVYDEQYVINILTEQAELNLKHGRIFTIEIKKECNFENITAEELLVSKFMTAITDKKLRNKLMKEKKPEMKKTIEMTKQNTFEKKRQKRNTGSTNIEPRKKTKEEPIQRMDKFNSRPRKKFDNNRPCRFCNAPNWNPTHKCPALNQTCNNCGTKGHFARTCRQREN